MAKKILFLAILFNITVNSFGIANFKALSLRSSIKETVQIKKEVSVIFFSSIDCPCSDSHLNHFIELKKKYPQMDFIGINENGAERLTEIKNYYDKNRINFDLYLDDDFSVADTFGAVKTPHVYVLNKKGEILYQGGVTNSSNFSNATDFYLKDVLSDISSGKAPRRNFARALGCYIPR